MLPGTAGRNALPWSAWSAWHVADAAVPQELLPSVMAYPIHHRNGPKLVSSISRGTQSPKGGLALQRVQ